ncbi:MAG: amidohydrolase, partial [Candidatus Marinimicrobia bacterium]|nr:amidohydrolase [Candidatus Neomarinimicrobiota bacterium]
MSIQKQNQSILLYNGNIFGKPESSAILCQHGKIVGFGKKEDFNIVNTIDLHGGFVYPGLIDSHLHLLGTGQALETIKLNGLISPLDVIPLFKTNIHTNKTNTNWILGRGWDQTEWTEPSYPDKTILDGVSPHIPIAFRRVDGHALWVNSKAMELAGVSKDTLSPDGGVIHKHSNGEPTGIFIDNAMNLILNVIPKPSNVEIRSQIIKAMSHLNSYGLTSIHDPGTDPETISVLMDKTFESTMGVYAMLNYKDDELSPYLEKGPLKTHLTLTIRAVKIYLDGALGSHGAALLKPYSDDSKNCGLILEDLEKVKKDIKTFNKMGFQSAIHCIGDKANRLALDLYSQSGNKECRNRIEHAQMIHQKDIPRFSELGVLPCMQPVHCTSDMGWLPHRIGKDRLCETYPWNSLIQAGSIIPGGSDAPIESPDPLKGIYATVTRKDEQGSPSGGWQGHETVSIENAIKMYTEW